MKHPINKQAITVSVGQFIREVRNGNKKPSMYNILKSNGVHSANRAKQLIERMISNNIIIKHRDNSYSLTRVNYEMQEVMSLLLNVPRKPREKKTPVLMSEIIFEDVNPLSQYSAQDLVRELRDRGFTVTAHRQIITTEEL